MTAALPGRVMALFRRASLLSGMLAIIAGIIGMHLMSGSHVLPATAAGLGVDTSRDAQVSAVITPAPGGGARPGAPAEQRPESLSGLSCADAGLCPAMTGMAAACIPSPGHPPLEAPLPGTTPFADTVPAALPAGFRPYPYLPGAPSPGDLCISRT